MIHEDNVDGLHEVRVRLKENEHNTGILPLLVLASTWQDFYWPISDNIVFQLCRFILSFTSLLFACLVCSECPFTLNLKYKDCFYPNQTFRESYSTGPNVFEQLQWARDPRSILMG